MAIPYDPCHQNYMCHNIRQYAATKCRVSISQPVISQPGYFVPLLLSSVRHATDVYSVSDLSKPVYRIKVLSIL